MDTPMKMAFVAGAGSGLGRGLSLALGERAYRVIVCDTSLDDAIAVVEEIRAEGGVAVPRCCDLTRTEEVEIVANMIVAQFGAPPDLVFVNVGATVEKPVLDYTKADWHWLLEVNLVAAWDIARVFARAALAAEKRCRLILTTWEKARECDRPELVGYAMSKSALLVVADALRAELSDRVDVTVLSPNLTHSCVGDAERYLPMSADVAGPLARINTCTQDALDTGRWAVDGVERGDAVIAPRSATEGASLPGRGRFIRPGEPFAGGGSVLSFPRPSR
jgi:NAD(P)-dependent dehydrogenase (short-subunit alcohol dehydrogenase family)